MTDDKIVHANIAGQTTEPATPEALARAMASCLHRFEQHLHRLPTDDESDMLWAAVQRYFGIAEHAIEPPSQRSH
jgi:hypothetical protein